MHDYIPKFLFALLIVMSPPLLAEGLSDNGSINSDVEQRIHQMDTNHDGMVTISEMRVSLEAIHGKGYEKTLLDEIEAKATGKSCASPFTKSFY